MTTAENIYVCSQLLVTCEFRMGLLEYISIVIPTDFDIFFITVIKVMIIVVCDSDIIQMVIKIFLL